MEAMVAIINENPLYLVSVDGKSQSRQGTSEVINPLDPRPESGNKAQTASVVDGIAALKTVDSRWTIPF